MKKILASLVVAASCIFSAGAIQAQAATNGIYAAPKFALNVQHFKGEYSEGGSVDGSHGKTAARAGGALAIGYDFNSMYNVPVRLELEYGAYGNTSKTESEQEGAESLSLKSTCGVQTLLANVYYDFRNSSAFTPYAGAGIGLGFVKSKAEFDACAPSSLGLQGRAGMDDTKAVFAGQAGFGCSYAFNENVSVDLGYRFLMMGKGDCEFNGVKLETKNLYSHQFMLGARFTF